MGVSAGATALLNWSYGYDLSDNIVSIQDALSAANSQVFGYDALDRLDCWQLNAAACTQTTYTYDKIGNLTSKPGNGVYSYAAQSASCSAGALDKAHAVVSISTTTFCYDLVGNRTSVSVNDGAPSTFSYNPANQITNAGYTYDNAGNLTADGSTTYSYDSLNRMTAIGAMSNVYNGDGALVVQTAGSITTK